MNKNRALPNTFDRVLLLMAIFQPVCHSFDHAVLLRAKASAEYMWVQIIYRLPEFSAHSPSQEFRQKKEIVLVEYFHGHEMIQLRIGAAGNNPFACPVWFIEVTPHTPNLRVNVFCAFEDLVKARPPS